jgi:hypothetical protein
MTARSTRYFRELGRPRNVRSGSRRRIEKIRLRGNWSREAILFFISMLFALTIVISWMLRHPSNDSDGPHEPTFRALH